MKNLPKVLPNYTIKKSEEPSFAVRHEELAGMLIIPREGEKLSFGMYDQPEGKMSGMYQLKVVGTVVLHGISGVEIASQYIDSNLSIGYPVGTSYVLILGGLKEKSGCLFLTMSVSDFFLIR